MTGNIKEKIEALVLEKNDIREALNTMYSYSEEFDTVYYRDIVKLSALNRIIEYNHTANLISSEDETDVREYLKISILELVKEISKEQESILEENLRFIKREIIAIRELIINYDEDEIIKSFSRLFLKIHSRHYKYFLRLISRDYDPSKVKIREYMNKKIMNLVDLHEKILFEKELIHKEILKNEILTNPKVNKIVEFLINGRIDEVLEFLEELSIVFIKNVKSLPVNQIRKPIELNYKYELLKFRQRGSFI